MEDDTEIATATCTYCFANYALNGSDDIGELLKEKHQFLLYQEIYNKFNESENFSVENNEISLNSIDFSYQILFLRDTKKFASHSDELNRHFIENLEKSREEIIKYFQKCCTNPQNYLPEFIFNHLINNLNQYSEISTFLKDTKEKLYGSTNNPFLSTLARKNFSFEEKSDYLIKFFQNNQIEIFIKNELQTKGVNSSIYRYILAFLCDLTIVICEYNIDKKIDIVQICHNELKTNEINNLKRSNASINIKIKPKIKEVFILNNCEKFTLLKFEKHKYQNFISQLKNNDKFEIIASTLSHFHQNKTTRSTIEANFNPFWKNVSKNYSVFENTFAEIFKTDEVCDDTKFLYDSIISKIPQIFYKIDENDELHIYEVDPSLAKDYSNSSEYIFKNEDAIKTQIEQFVNYISVAGGSSIIKALAIRLFNENNVHNSEEFLITMKAIFSLLVKHDAHIKPITFMILGNKQEQWIPEIILLKIRGIIGTIENKTYQKHKRILESKQASKILPILLNKIMNYEDDLDENYTTKLNNFDHIITNLEFFDDSMIENLKELNILYWKMITTEKYWDTMLQNLKINHQYKDTTVEKIKCSLEDISNKFGLGTRDLLNIFLEKMEKENNQKFDFHEFIEKFNTGKWIFSDKILDIMKETTINKWSKKIQDYFGVENSGMNVNNIINVIQSNNETSPSIKSCMDEIKKQVELIKTTTCNFNSKKILDFTLEEIKEWLTRFKTNKFKSSSLSIVEPLAIVTRVFKLKSSIDLRDNQLISILTMWHSNKGILMQVSTGEGKTYIGVAFAVLKHLYGEKVDIVTSSSVLAERDANDKSNKDIFNFFDINVGHNCDEEADKRQDVYENCHIVYGTLGNFQRDYLLTEFYEKDIMLKNDNNEIQHFKNILVDEVDSMLLDKGNNILYLSEDIPNIDEIESVFVFLRFWIVQNFNSIQEKMKGLDVAFVRKALLDFIYGTITEEDIEKMDPNVDPNEVIQELKSLKIIDDRNLLIEENFSETRILTALYQFGQDLPDQIISFCRVKIQTEKLIRIPNYLKDFVLLHLNKWIESAIRSIFMNNKRDFIVERSLSKDVSESSEINILDLDTGTNLNNSHWDDALHQMLQLKYNCELTLLGLKSVFISNVSFIKKYKRIFGMTGTLGNSEERLKIQKIYDVDYATIPRYYSRKFSEFVSTSLPKEDQWVEKIYQEVKLMLRKNQSVLIICETIEDTEFFRKQISGLLPSENLRVYNRDYEDFNIHDFKPCNVVISTNLAGRGTDIKISNELNKNGGLHVILTFLPPNSRIEEQAFGRAARSNNNGSGHLIFCNKEVTTKLKEIRNQNELKRLDQIVTYYENFIKVEEEFFEKFQKAYKELKAERRNELFKDIYLKNFIIQWSLWLDRNSVLLDDWKNCNKKSEVKESLERFLNETHVLHPIMNIELFKYHDKNKKFSSAQEILNNGFNNELFVYQYYKLYGMIKAKQEKKGCMSRELDKEEKVQLIKCYKMISEIKTKQQINAEIIKCFKENPNKDQPPLEFLQMQQNKIAEIINLFENNIKMIIGNDITADTFCSITDNIMFRKILYEELLLREYLLPPRISKVIDDTDVREIARKYRVNYVDLSNILKQYSGKDIKLDEFGSLLREKLKIPSRLEFWKCLISKEIITNEIEFVVVDINAIQTIDPSAGDIIVNLPKENIWEYVNLRIFFIPINQKESHDETKVVVRLKDLQSVLSQKTIDSLIEFDVAKLNFCGVINSKRIEDYKKLQSEKIFEHFDEVRLEDFECITRNYERIVEKLVKINVLIPRNNNKYGLNYENIKLVLDEKELNEEYGFQREIYELLKYKFSYRIELENLILDVTKETFDSVISLDPNPIISFLLDLISKVIIELSKLRRNLNLNANDLFPDESSKDTDNDDGDDGSDSKTNKLLRENRKNLKQISEQIKEVLQSCASPLSDKSILKNPEIALEPVAKLIPDNKAIPTIEQKGLGNVIKFQEKGTSSWFSWITFIIKVVVIIVLIAALLKLAGYLLPLLLARISSIKGLFFGGLKATKTAGAVSYTKLVFKSLDLFIAFCLIAQKAVTFICFIFKKLIRIIDFISTQIANLIAKIIVSVPNFLRKPPTAPKPSQTNNDEKNENVKVFMDETLSLQNVAESAIKLLESTAKSVMKTAADIGNKINKLLDPILSKISPFLEKLLNFFDVSKINSVILNAFQCVTESISKLCAEVSTKLIVIFNEMLKKLMQNSHLDNLHLQLENDDNIILNLINEVYKILSKLLQNEVEKAEQNQSTNLDNKEGVSDPDLETNKKDILLKLKESILAVYRNQKDSKIVHPTISAANESVDKFTNNNIDKNVKILKPSSDIRSVNKNVQELLRLTKCEEISPEEVFAKEFVSIATTLLSTTNSSEVYADIIRYNVPMDMVGIIATRMVLENRFGVPFVFVITFNGNQIVFGDKNDQKAIVINLDLVEGHFINRYQPNKSSCNNNCLYYAISDHFNRIMEMTPEEWRDAVANVVLTNEDIQSIILNRVHTHYTIQGFIGGNIQQNPFDRLPQQTDGNKNSDENEQGQNAESQDTESDNVINQLLDTFYLVDSYATISSQTPRRSSNNYFIPIESDHVFPFSVLNQYYNEVRRGAEDRSNIYEILQSFIRPNTNTLNRAQLPAMVVSAIAHQNFLTSGRSRTARRFRNDLLQLLLNGQIEVALQRIFADQHNTIIQVREELTEIHHKQSLRRELRRLHLSQANLVSFLQALGFLNDSQVNYLLNAILNFPKTTYIEWFKQMYSKMMKLRNDHKSLLKKLNQLKLTDEGKETEESNQNNEQKDPKNDKRKNNDKDESKRPKTDGEK